MPHGPPRLRQWRRAALWFGGFAFTNSGEKVDYTKIRNGAFQIEAALNMHFSDKGVYPTGTSAQILNALVTEKYLTAIPDGGYQVQSNQIIRSLADVQHCYKLNKLSLITTADECPSCTDATNSPVTGKPFASYIACQQS